MRPLVILRPEPGASKTLRGAEALGLSAKLLPLFRIEPVAWTAPDLAHFDALLVTSANAVRHAGPKLKSLRALPAYAVGAATAAALRTAGFDVRASGSSGVDALLADVKPSMRLLHLCGEDRHVPNGGRAITQLVVYRSAPTASPADTDLPHDAVALVHSPRAGQRLAELVHDRRGIRVAAISQAAADACGHGWAEVAAASQPSDDALLSLGERLCKGPDPQ